MIVRKALAAAVLLLLTTMVNQGTAQARDCSVIEVVTLKLKSGITAAQFGPIDHEIETSYVSKRPGFLSRESAPGANGSWVAIIHWRTAADADASMSSFSTAGASEKFISMIEPNSMVMTRYGWDGADCVMPSGR